MIISSSNKINEKSFQNECHPIESEMLQYERQWELLSIKNPLQKVIDANGIATENRNIKNNAISYPGNEWHRNLISFKFPYSSTHNKCD